MSQFFWCFCGRKRSRTVARGPRSGTLPFSTTKNEVRLIKSPQRPRPARKPPHERHPGPPLKTIFSLFLVLLMSVASAVAPAALWRTACDLQSYIVEEAGTKAHLLEVLSAWDPTEEMQVLVLNGHFATGKTYIANVLARVLEHSSHLTAKDQFDDFAANAGSGRGGASPGAGGGGHQSSGGGVLGRVKRAGSWLARQWKSLGLNDKAKNQTNRTASPTPLLKTAVEIFVTEDSFINASEFFVKIDAVMRDETTHLKIIVFDDLPCWRDTERITRVLTRCLQFSHRCRGALFLITTNDGWCPDE